MTNAFTVCSMVALVVAGAAGALEIDPTATIKDSPTTLMGVNHIGLSVKDLDRVLTFYQEASGFELLHREKVNNSSSADKLFGHDGVEYEIAVLKAPNMLFELVEFKHNAGKPTERMPFQGPGMTHTCFQTTSSDSGYDRFRRAGAHMLTRGDGPIDLAGRGVTYAYGYDPSGNMFEMEQLDPAPLSHDPVKGRWLSEGHSMWMTQVALATHDLDRMTAWFEKVLAFKPYREGDYVEHPGMVQVADNDGVSLKVSWFLLAERTKALELWQVRVPETKEYKGKRDVTDFGYSYSLEVGDIKTEFARMKGLGVEFVGEPVRVSAGKLGDYWQVYTHDVDGNVFALRQWVDLESPFSVAKMDR